MLLHDLLVGQLLPSRVTRETARSAHHVEGPLAALPTVRMAWCTRPPPRRVWATPNAPPRSPSMASAGTRDVWCSAM